MRKIYQYTVTLFFLFVLLIATKANNDTCNSKVIVVKQTCLYDELQLATLGLNKTIFERAIAEWNVLSAKEHIEKNNILSIADLSQSSKSKRLYVIDVANKKVLFNTYVAHGRNSGDEFATSFSNKENSFQSSLGFYITANTYQGAHGLSLRLKGIEKGINDIAENRGIVVHGASYVSESFINNFGRLGRSQGCPAVPIELCTPIINSIKGGSCFFMFYPDKNYFNKTALI